MPLKIAAIVCVYNEKDFLEQFIRHYEPEVDTIFVIDNESTDGSTAGLAARHPKVVLSTYSTGGQYDDPVKHKTLVDKKNECAGKFDYVLLLDCDEFVVPKKHRSIREAIEATGRRPIYGTDGWNIHSYDENVPYDPSRPILSQRKWGVPNAHYSKPIVVRPEYAAQYCLGCHWVNDGQDTSLKDPDRVEFWLFHLRGFDDAIYLRRSFERVSRMKVPFPGHYYWQATEQNLRDRLAYDKQYTNRKKVVPDRL